MFMEFLKTKRERTDLLQKMKIGKFRPENHHAIEEYIKDMEDKLDYFIEKFEDIFATKKINEGSFK